MIIINKIFTLLNTYKRNYFVDSLHSVGHIPEEFKAMCGLHSLMLLVSPLSIVSLSLSDLFWATIPMKFTCIYFAVYDLK